MSGITAYGINLGDTDYPVKYSGLLAFLDPYIDELVAAREGQASLLANNLRYIKNAAGLTQNLPANGYRIQGLPTPVAADEPATKAFAEGLAFSSALPGVSAVTKGLEITNNGTVSKWGHSAAAAAGAMAFWF